MAAEEDLGELRPVERKAALARIAARLREKQGAWDHELRSTVAAAIEIGETLNAAKNLSHHREWLPWVASNFRGSIDTAEIYMDLARHSEHVRNLPSIRAAQRVLRDMHHQRRTLRTPPDDPAARRRWLDEQDAARRHAAAGRKALYDKEHSARGQQWRKISGYANDLAVAVDHLPWEPPLFPARAALLARRLRATVEKLERLPRGEDRPKTDLGRHLAMFALRADFVMTLANRDTIAELDRGAALGQLQRVRAAVDAIEGALG